MDRDQNRVSADDLRRKQHVSCEQSQLKASPVLPEKVQFHFIGFRHILTGFDVRF